MAIISEKVSSVTKTDAAAPAETTEYTKIIEQLPPSAVLLISLIFDITTHKDPLPYIKEYINNALRLETEEHIKLVQQYLILARKTDPKEPLNG